MTKPVVILGVFAADTTYRAPRQPKMGETLLGSEFRLSPGGKGSNQAVACARAGGDAHFITRLGHDAFADMAFEVWRNAGVTPATTQHADSHTGAAYIFLHEDTGDNAIIICPGAAGDLSADDLDANRALIEGAGVFMTQLEQPLPAALRGFEIARSAGVTTILNPAPATDLSDDMLGLCDWITPNESEAEGLTGIEVDGIDSAGRAADALMSRGVDGAIITLGAQGVLLCDGRDRIHIPAKAPGAVIETTGAGDAFNGGFAAALARGMSPTDAARFGCATAGISVTRAGAANSMPTRDEIEALLG